MAWSRASDALMASDDEHNDEATNRAAEIAYGSVPAANATGMTHMMAEPSSLLDGLGLSEFIHLCKKGE